MKKIKYTKEEWSWILQDWANSAYSLIVTTAIFPLFYKAVASSSGVSEANSTAYLAYANSIATIIAGLSAPILGAVADHGTNRKQLFTASTLLGAISVLIMGLSGNLGWKLLLVLYVCSAIGASCANIFYDASLLDVTNSSRMSQVSSMGFSMGYIGSTVPFIIVIILLKFFDTTKIIRFSFVLTAVWWLFFTIPYWKNVKQKTFKENKQTSNRSIIKESLTSLKRTLKEIPKHKNIFRFLLAYFLYIDGVGTIIKMATSVGSDVGISGNSLIVVLLFVQLVAFPFTIIYGQLSKRYGDKKMIYVGIITYIIICLLAYFMTSAFHFYILAFLVGTAQGGIQSLSRSLFGKLVPEGKSNEFFGIYNIFGKFSSLIGTSLLAIITQLTGNSLNGVFGLIVLFVIGGLLLTTVKEADE